MFIPIWVGWPFWIGAFFTLSTVRAQLSGVGEFELSFLTSFRCPKETDGAICVLASICCVIVRSLIDRPFGLRPCGCCRSVVGQLEVNG